MKWWLRVLGGAGVLVVSFSTTLWILLYLDKQKLDSSGSWKRLTVVDTGATKDDLGWPGCTLRVVIPATAVTGSGEGIAVKFGAGPVRGLHITESFIGQSAPEGPPYAFDKPPVRLTFEGKQSTLIPKRSSAVSDDSPEFRLAKGRSLVIAFYVKDTSNDDPIAKQPTPGWRTFYKCRRDTDTVQATGYEERSEKFVSHGVLSVDVIRSN
ncbi:hypothetical protein [Bradyrhizobium sp. CCBAU 53415]|uniref:hypothetical protein n=1 Tax=Bradyrhizobium sp. CCBAU 53415 TaxID=1325119 RepID=UPI0023061876|nr:hypothetical protein [Bradyrhizobium sp. CCBAU 53415]